MDFARDKRGGANSWLKQLNLQIRLIQEVLHFPIFPIWYRCVEIEEICRCIVNGGSACIDC